MLIRIIYSQPLPCVTLSDILPVYVVITAHTPAQWTNKTCRSLYIIGMGASIKRTGASIIIRTGASIIRTGASIIIRTGASIIRTGASIIIRTGASIKRAGASIIRMHGSLYKKGRSLYNKDESLYKDRNLCSLLRKTY